jgi:hypothetical protein
VTPSPSEEIHLEPVSNGSTPDNGQMLVLQRVSHPYFFPIVECTIVCLPHHVGKLSEGEFHMLQANVQLFISTAQVQPIVDLIFCVIIVVGYLQQQREQFNHYN